MIVMGLDLATRSGFAVRDSDKHRSSIECGVFSVKEYEWEAKYAVAGMLFYRIVKQYGPHFVAIEKPEHGVRQFKKKGKADLASDGEMVSTINPAALQLTGIAGAVISVCTLLKIPYGLIGASSWRPIYYGKGVKPKDGQDWKDMAIATCEMEGIALPSRKADKKDAAEAVGVCTCWHKCEVPQIEWMQRRFVDLRTGAYAEKDRRAKLEKQGQAA